MNIKSRNVNGLILLNFNSNRSSGVPSSSNLKLYPFLENFLAPQCLQ